MKIVRMENNEQITAKSLEESEDQRRADTKRNTPNSLTSDAIITVNIAPIIIIIIIIIISIISFFFFLWRFDSIPGHGFLWRGLTITLLDKPKTVGLLSTRE